MFEWQFLFFMWLISTTIASLLYRRFAIKSNLSPLVSAAVRGFVVSAPLMWVIALVTGDFTMPSLTIIGFAALEAALGLIYGLASFKAIKQSDASTFSTLIKLSVIPLVLFSSLLLGEGLTALQCIGATLLMLSGFIVGKVHLTKRSLAWMLTAIVSIALMNLVDRYLVESVGVITALTTVFTIGPLLHLPFTAKSMVRDRAVIKRELPSMVILAVMTFIQVVTFIWATDVAGNLSLLYSLSASKVVLVTIAAAVFLGERDNLKLKVSSALIATIGILII